MKGHVKTPGDKSISHRMALMSLLYSGQVRVENLSTAADVCSSLEAVKLLGVNISQDGDELLIEGANGKIKEQASIDCGNSGTTIRLMMGILAGLEGNYTLDGDDSLRARPMERVAKPLREMGADIETTNGKCPVQIRPAGLRGISYELPVASAQLKSAILLAGLCAHGNTTVTGPLNSRDHTERLIKQLRGHIETDNNKITVKRSGLKAPARFKVPGDPSSAAFFLSAAAMIPDGDVIADGVLLNPGRLGFVNVLKRMGADVTLEELGSDPEPWGRIGVKSKKGLNACVVEEKEIPALVDEIPILALLATQVQGVTEFKGVGELRVKESDRLEAVSNCLTAMGAKVEAGRDNLIVEGPTILRPVLELSAYGDHRIAMTIKVASALIGESIHIDDEQCINISYPEFNEHLNRLMK